MTSSPRLALDHLVVAARTLDEGVAWCAATLGVTPAAGGRHPMMGTCNRVLAIGHAAWPRAYLEIIAIDPQAPPPGRARWFALDGFDAAPRLVHWVARVDEGVDALPAAIAAQRAAGVNPGDAEEATRGALRWRITLTPEGRLNVGGAAPTLIGWHDAAHPANTLPDVGVSLQALRVRGLPPTLPLPTGVQRLSNIGPAVEAELDTPRGPVTLTTTTQAG